MVCEQLKWLGRKVEIHSKRNKHSEKEKFLKYLLYLDWKNTLRTSQGNAIGS